MKYTTTLSLTALSFLLPFSAPARAEVTKSPHGLFQVGGDAATNPVIDGVRLPVKWTDIQPESASAYDWSGIDKAVTDAQANQKQVGISLVLLSDPPAWLSATPGVRTYLLPVTSGPPLSVVLPWDPVVQEKIIDFVSQLCLRYDGVADYIVMGGMGLGTETAMPEPADIGLDMILEDAVAAWRSAANNIIDAYATHLSATPCMMAAELPFNGTDARTALTDVVDRAAALYGERFGIMNWKLSGGGTAGYLPDALIAQYSRTNPVGFQFLCPVAGDGNGQTFGGTLEEALDAAIALGAQWLEIDDQDATNPAYTAAFESARAALAPPPAAQDMTPSSAPPPSPDVNVKAPHGLYEIGGDAWTNPNISGWKAELLWSQSNTLSGIYDWSKLDALVANAVKYKKQLGVSLKMLSSPPGWLTAMPGVKTYKTLMGPDPMVLPWDPLVQPWIIAYIKAFCLHFDGKLDYVVIGGLGFKTETYMPLPADIGLDMTIPAFIAAWINSSNLFIDTYTLNLHTTPFVIAGGLPFKDPGASAAITTVINHGLLYPTFGITQWGLNANSNNGFLINKFIQDNDLGRATGFQLTGASDGSVGGDLHGTLDQALGAGAALGADWIEVYAADAMNPKNAAVLAKYNTLLK